MKPMTSSFAMLCRYPAPSPSRWAIGLWAVGLVLVGTAAVCALSAEEAPPWRTNRPIVTVKKDLYRQHARPRAAALASVTYVGSELQRREVQAEEVASDVGDNIRARWSSDNGRTWTEFVPVQPSNNVNYAGVTVWEGEGAGVFDPRAGVLLQSWLRQIVVDGLYHCFTYSRFRATWGTTGASRSNSATKEGRRSIRASRSRPHSSTTMKAISATICWCLRMARSFMCWLTATLPATRGTTSAVAHGLGSVSGAVERGPPGL